MTTACRSFQFRKEQSCQGRFAAVALAKLIDNDDKDFEELRDT